MVKKIKILTLGDSLCGKSCIIKQFCENNFNDIYIETIGIDYGVRTIEINKTNSISLHFWDTSGKDQYQLIRNEFYQDTQGILLVYDITNINSFLNIEKYWLHELNKHFNTSNLPIIILCANKIDLIKSAKITKEQGQQLAIKYNWKYYEISAKNNINIKTIFQAIYSKFI